MSAAARPDAWWKRAACIGTSWELWRPPNIKTGRGARPAWQRDADAERYAQAAAVCAACPVVAECRADADRIDDPAFRAGYSAADRHRQNTGRW